MALYPLTVCLVFGILVAAQNRPRIAAGIGLVMAVFGLMSIHTLIFLCGLGLAVVGPIAASATQVRWKRALLVTVTIAACWVPFVAQATSRVRLAQRLKPKFQFESLADRVRPIAQPFLTERADTLRDRQNSRHLSKHSSYGRIRAIRALHRSATHHFLNAPEFGIARMLYPRLSQLEDEFREPILLSELDVGAGRANLTPSDEVSQALTQAEFRETAAEGHREVSSWFVPPDSIGEIQDVHAVAGFRPHGIHRQSFEPYHRDDPAGQVRNAFMNRYRDQDEPTALPDFRLTKIQLVGLLYHDTPVVYDVDSLPDSATARTAPTRPLDEFESDALSQLQSGETLVTQQQPDHIRVFGGLWNAESCQQCHEGNEKQLLGAFSYRLIATQPNSDS